MQRPPPVTRRLTIFTVPDGPAVSFPVTIARLLELLKRLKAPEAFNSNRQGPVATGPRRFVSASVTVRVQLSTIVAGAASERDAAAVGNVSAATAARVRVRSVVVFTGERVHADSFDGEASLLYMCRNIRTLHNFEPPADEEEIQASALQYVRKLSGVTKPSRANEAVFEWAVEEVAAATRRLLDGLVTAAAPRDREVEAAKARERSVARFARASSA